MMHMNLQPTQQVTQRPGTDERSLTVSTPHDEQTHVLLQNGCANDKVLLRH